jgi:hypothetical protein
MAFDELSYWLQAVNEYNRTAAETVGGGDP